MKLERSQSFGTTKAIVLGVGLFVFFTWPLARARLPLGVPERLRGAAHQRAGDGDSQPNTQDNRLGRAKGLAPFQLQACSFACGV